VSVIFSYPSDNNYSGMSL